ncbi:MAG: DUF389 domain-containing protein [Rubrobacteraceae bacterium]
MTDENREAGEQPQEGPETNGNGMDGERSDPPDRPPSWWRQLAERTVSTTDERRREVMEELLPEGAALRSYVFRFIILQSLAVLIALFGLLTDSAAVVIGAMLVAPLMRPVLGIAASLVTGRPIRRGASYLIVLGASVGSVFLAWAVTKLLPIQFATSLPGEILARTGPGLLDLGIALAAGAAGAYALVRREVSDALPGVAVAVALVPPLATVGSTFALGRPDLAAGALLLYLTNLTAIVLVGAVVFVLTGFAPRSHVVRTQRQVRRRMIYAVILVGAISIPLLLHTIVETAEQWDTGQATEEVDQWLQGTNLRATRINASFEAARLDAFFDGEDSGTGVANISVINRVVVDVTGPDPPPPVENLAAALAKRHGDRVKVEVRWTKSREISAEATP